MPLITRQQLDGLQLKRKLLDVPDWATPEQAERGEVPQVLIRELTGAERDNYENGMMTIRNKGKQVERTLNLANARARFVALIMINEDGTRMYTDKEVYLVGKLPAAGLDYVWTQGNKLSGITEDEQEQLEEIAEEDFTKAVTDGSGID